jgi:hypothetical protein
MMNGFEKSDSAIVAMKPANKAGGPVAERVEQRAGTKGNTGQPRTRRTQSRSSVSPGLERVRQAGPTLCRHSPKVGAQCVNCARWDLCGGYRVTGIPTAILGNERSKSRYVKMSGLGIRTLLVAAR